MALATAATGIGKQVVTHAVRTWLGARQELTQRDAELVDLVKIGVRDHFKQRKLVRQLEDLADQIAERLRPVYEHDFRNVAEGERAAALYAVVDALEAADLTDATLFAVDVDARKLARLVRERVPVRRVGLAEPAEQLYNAVLDESCMALVQVVKHLPAFEPRALAELLGRFSQVKDDIAEVLHRLPRTTLDAPRGSERDEEFRARVRLRSYADRPLPRPQQLLTGVADPLVDLLPEGWVHRQLSNGRALLLVDGVDELVTAQRPAVRKWLQGLLAEYPQIRVVVTARPGAADRGWLAAESFAPVLLERMSPLDVAAFCRRWHDAMRDAAQRSAVELPCRTDELPEYERALLRQLDGRRPCADWPAARCCARCSAPSTSTAAGSSPRTGWPSTGTPWRCCWNAATPSVRYRPAAASCWMPAANSPSCST